jgi:hypothetical protein
MAFESVTSYATCLTYQALKKRFVLAWDTGAIAAVYFVAMWLVLRMRG